MQRETKAQRDERVNRILALLDEEYGTDYRCYLNHETPWQLLIAVIMSAQCTDARVNIVTADLFKKYDTLEKFANADLKELEKDIHSTGFYHMKAKNIIACCKSLVENFGGEVPRTLEELTSLAGVGRKTANVIRGNIYNEPSIVVDTHVKRISRLLRWEEVSVLPEVLNAGSVSLEKIVLGRKKGNNVRKFRIIGESRNKNGRNCTHNKGRNEQAGNRSGKGSRFIRGNRFRDNRAGSEAR